MTGLNLAYDLANYTPADANPVQSNFQRVEQHSNTELINRDGSIAMIGQLKLVGDPKAPLDAVTKQYVDLLLPIGVMLPYAGPGSAPGAGTWAICNGAVLAESAYPELFTIIQKAWNPSAAAGSFSLPNMADRVPVGAGTETGIVGAYGGSNDAPLVNHQHNARHAHTNSVADANTDHAHKIDYHVHTGTSDWGGTHNHGWGPEAFLYNSASNSDYGLVHGSGAGGIRAANWAEAPNHQHTYTTNANWNGAGTNTGWQSQTLPEWGKAGATHGHTVTVNEANYNTGDPIGPGVFPVSAAKGNLPKYAVINWIIRVK